MTSPSPSAARRVAAPHDAELFAPLRARVAALRDGVQPLVLLCTGAFNPVHRMHVGAFVAAKRGIEHDARFAVVGGFISPSHDGYVGPKLGRHLIHAPDRIEMCRRAVADEPGTRDWVQVDAWEAAQSGFVDRDDVSGMLDVRLRTCGFQTPAVADVQTVTDAVGADRPIRVVYLCGSDHLSLLASHWTLDPLGVVCVAREALDTHGFERAASLANARSAAFFVATDVGAAAAAAAADSDADAPLGDAASAFDVTASHGHAVQLVQRHGAKLPLSSTLVRDVIEHGKSLVGIVYASTAHFLVEHKLLGATADALNGFAAASAAASAAPAAAASPAATRPAPAPDHTAFAPALALKPLSAARDFPPCFADIDSTRIAPHPYDGITGTGLRDALLDAFAQYGRLPRSVLVPPVVSASEFVPRALVEHLMRAKKDSALYVKYERGDEITNMEGVMHTFVTPVCGIYMTGDYHWAPGHSVKRHPAGAARHVVLSASVQPDFERSDRAGAVMYRLCGLRDTPVAGAPLPAAFGAADIPDAATKADGAARERYDAALEAHMVYHLTRAHAKPSGSAARVLSYAAALAHVEAQLGASDVDAILASFDGAAVVIGRGDAGLMSLEMLLHAYLHQIRNEFSVLEAAFAQGYVYSIDPPAIFVSAFGRGDVLNRLQTLAFHILRLGGEQFAHLRAIAFNEFADRANIGFLRRVFAGLAHVAVGAKCNPFPTAMQLPAACAVVVHNNSDGFGQNIETEGMSSMDGVIGVVSDAAVPLMRTRQDLLSFVV